MPSKIQTPARPPACTPEPRRGEVGRKVYDRTSFEDDFLVTIPGPTAEDFERYAPERPCGKYFDGLAGMPSPMSDRHQEQVLFLSMLLPGSTGLPGFWIDVARLWSDLLPAGQPCLRRILAQPPA